MISIPRLPFREDRIFSVLVLMLLIVPLIFYWGLNEKFETIKLSFWLLLLAWVAFLVFSKKNLVFLNKPLKLLLCCFLLFGFLSALFSISPLNGFLGFYPRFTSGFLFYCLWVFTLIFFLSTLDRPKWEFVAKIIFLDAFIIAIVGLLQSFGIGYYEGINQAFIARAPGLLGNPNFSSMFIVCAMPFVLPLFKNSTRFFSKIYYIFASLVMLGALINFSSRGAFLALFLGFVFILFLILLGSPTKKIILFSLLSIFLAGVLILGFMEVTRPRSVASAFNFSASDTGTRLFAWDVARRAVFDHPFLGYGPGSLQLYFEKYREINLSKQSGVFDDAHNLFLQMAATTGLPFTLSFLGILGLAFWNGYKNIKENKKNFWVIALISSLIIWIIAASFNPVSTANFFILIILLSGLMLNFVRLEDIKSAGLYRYLILLLPLTAVIFGILFLSAEVLYYKGYESYLVQNFSQSEKQIKWAIRFNPTNQLYYLYFTADQIILNSKELTFEKSVNKIINLQPQGAKSYVMAANLSYLMFDKTKDRIFLKKAIEYMEQSLEFDRFFPARYSHLAFYLAEDGQLPLAREYLKTALSLDSSQLSSWLLLARVYQLENRPVQMRYSLNEAFKLRPDDAYLKQLNLLAKQETAFKSLQIPALINIFQIEP